METNTPNVTDEAGGAGSAPAVVENINAAGGDITIDSTGLSPETPDLTGSEPEEKSKTVKEIIHLRKRAQEAELENARLRGVIEGKGGVTPGPASISTPSVTPAPKEEEEPLAPDVDKYEKYEDYEKAEKDYLIKRAKWEMKQEFLADQKKNKEAQAVRSWGEKVAKAQAKIPDLIQVISNPAFGQTDTLMGLLRESEIGPEIAYYLGKNLAEADRLNSLSPVMAAKEFGKLEMKLAAPPAAKPPKNVITQAPEPIRPVVPSGGVEVDDQDLSMDEFVKKRNARELARRRGQTI